MKQQTVAIYARVSTKPTKLNKSKSEKPDKSQDPENQLRDLRAWCKRAGHKVVAEYGV